MQLAQLNIGAFRYPIEDPRMDGFTKRLGAINALAERSEGFIWRLVDDNPMFDAATDLRLPGEGNSDMAVNLSVWRDVESLYGFVYNTVHARVMKDRLDYFEPATEDYLVLWWVEDGHIPSLEEAAEKLALIREKGPTPDAFSFREPFGAAGTPMRLPADFVHAAPKKELSHAS